MARILTCDDAAFLRMQLKKLLVSNGHTVIGEAENGRACIDAYSRLRPDVVLMDITMPDMDGITATKEIMKLDPNAVIIMVSAMGVPEKVFEAIAAGAKDFVVKPYNEQKVLACIAKYV